MHPALLTLCVLFAAQVCGVDAKHRRAHHRQTRAVADNCQASCPACPDKDTNLFNATGHIINPSQYGKFTKSVSCDRMYMISTTKMTWLQANDQCCKLGMKLISFNTQQEYDCFNNFVKGKKNCASTWTSGTDSDCVDSSKKIFTWCGTSSAYPAQGSSWWGPKDPNNVGGVEECIEAKVGVRNFLIDKNCRSRTNYVCEGPLNPTTIPTTTPAPCIDCNICARNSSLFDSSNDLIDQNQYGYWYYPPDPGPEEGYFKRKSEQFHHKKSHNYIAKRDADVSQYQQGGSARILCNTIYLIHKTEMSWKNAKDFCCKLGMSLITIMDEWDWDCTSAAIQASGFEGDFWTDATSDSCDTTQFIWCDVLMDVDMSILNNKFKMNEPSSLVNEKCFALATYSDSAGHHQNLFDTDCSDMLYPMCV